MKRPAIALACLPLACLTLACLSMADAGTANAAAVFAQSHAGTGTLHKSSWYPPDGLDGDAYCWDNFTLSADASITEVHWRGGYEYHPAGTGQAPVSDFEVSIYRSIGGGSQPDLAAGGQLVRYYVGGNAGETPAGTFGGVALDDYVYTLPSPFPATGGVKYWVRIVASQGAAAPSYAPDWGLATGTGGNNGHFRYITGSNYQAPPQDLAFSLVASDAPTATIATAVQPAAAGTVSGAGAYPLGSTVSLQATAGPGWGFLNWTEGASVVSTNAHYTFPAAANRSLTANFTAAWTVVTSVYPAYGGAATGGGTFNDGQTVTLTAIPAHGFVFTGWSDGSLTSTISFPAAYDLQITAFFASAPDFATFDFDSTPAGTPFPINVSNGIVGAQFAGGYSIQSVGTLGIAPAGMSGNYAYPSSVFASDLLIDFDKVVTDFSILYAVDELACDTSATMRVTGYLNGVLAGTNTMVAPVPGIYPSATLTLVAPGGFNHVVVHWQSPGLLCQDYGPIFFADNVTVKYVPTTSGLPTDVPHGVAQLLDPAPNPFNPSTSIRLVLPVAGPVLLDVYDAAGRRVRELLDETLDPGQHVVTWDGRDDAGRALGSGLYVLRMRAGGASDSRRLLLVK